MKETRDIRLNVRLSEMEYEKLKADAEKMDLKYAAYLRYLLMHTEVKAKPKEEWTALVQQVSGIGNNINQLTRLAHRKKEVDDVTLQEIKKYQEQIWDKMMEY